MFISLLFTVQLMKRLSFICKVIIRLGSIYVLLKAQLLFEELKQQSIYYPSPSCFFLNHSSSILLPCQGLALASCPMWHLVPHICGTPSHIYTLNISEGVQPLLLRVWAEVQASLFGQGSKVFSETPPRKHLQASWLLQPHFQRRKSKLKPLEYAAPS